MLNERRAQIAIGALLLAIGVLGVALAGVREVLLHSQRHVAADISNVDGTVQVLVDCEQALAVTTGETEEADLGWLPLDARLFLSVTSVDRHPAWDFRITGNDDVIFEGRRGHTKTLAPATTEANAVVFAKAFAAGGDYLGPIGCQNPGVVSLTDVPGYVQSPDDGEVPVANAEESPFRPRHFPYDQIDAIGRWSLVALSVLGAITAIGTPAIRRSLWLHKGTLATGALAILGAGFFNLATVPTI
jgi:hypothetical protein